MRLIIILVILLFASPVFAYPVKVLFHPNGVGDEVLGYNVYASQVSGAHNKATDLVATVVPPFIPDSEGLIGPLEDIDLDLGEWFIVATAYNIVGESNISREIGKKVLAPLPVTGVQTTQATIITTTTTTVIVSE